MGLLKVGERGHRYPISDNFSLFIPGKAHVIPSNGIFYAKGACQVVIIAGQVCVVNRGGFTPFSSFMNILTFLKRKVI